MVVFIVVAAGDMMKFIVSGGVTEIDDEEEVPAKPVSANLQQGENI